MHSEHENVLLHVELEERHTKQRAAFEIEGPKPLGANTLAHRLGKGTVTTRTKRRGSQRERGERPDNLRRHALFHFDARAQSFMTRQQCLDALAECLQIQSPLEA